MFDSLLEDSGWEFDHRGLEAADGYYEAAFEAAVGVCEDCFVEKRFL